MAIKKTRRVEAWIREVINPLEEALEREVVDARNGVPSFRWRTDSLEVFRNFRLLLGRSGSRVLDDLESQYPHMADMERRHDSLISTIAPLSRALFEALSNNLEFKAFVERNFRGVSDANSMVKDVAGALVNNDPLFGDEPEGSYHAAWNRCLEELREFRAASYEPLRDALAELEARSDRMRLELVRLRAQLVDEFDIPPGDAV